MKKIDRTQILICIGLLLLLVITREYLRTQFSDVWVLTPVLGSLPNFIGAYLFTNIPYSQAINREYKKGLRIMTISAVLVFIILVKEEYYPYFTASKTADPIDILFSVLGGAAAIFYYRWYRRRLS